MNGYELTITNGEEKIFLFTGGATGSPSITDVRFKMSTLNENLMNRASGVRAELIIQGTITEQTRGETLKLAKWAIDNNMNTLYRAVQLIVYPDEERSGDVLRTYRISNMFVINYDELFSSEPEKNGNPADAGKFVLFIAQKEGQERPQVFSE